MRLHGLFAISTLLASLLLAACNNNTEQSTTAPALPAVTVAKPLVQTISDWDNFIGQFEAVNRVEMKPRVSGYLVSVNFTDGQMVKAGDLLFTIDARPFEASLQEARSRVAGTQARVKNASSELERARGLVDIQAISQEEFDTLDAAALSASSEYEAARAALQSAQLNVDFTRIVAPISGLASYRRVDIGNAVKADETLLTTIVSVDPIHFSFQGSEALYLKYKRANAQVADSGAAVRIRLQDQSDYSLTGQLDFLDNVIDTASGTIRGRATLANPDGFLSPGMFGHMQLQSSGEYEGLLLPDTAIATRGAQRIVYLVDAAGMVSSREVQMGPLNGGLRVIRAGITADDLVIIDGLQRAIPGTSVQPTVGSISQPLAQQNE